MSFRSPLLGDPSERSSTNIADADGALHLSEAELRGLCAAMSDLVLVLDRDGTLLQIAPTAGGRAFAAAIQLVGKRADELLSADRSAELLACVCSVLASRQSARVEFDLLLEGETRWLSGTLSPAREDRVICVARDITERKRAEQGLQAREAQLAAVVVTQQEIATAGFELVPLMQRITERSQQLTRADGAVVELAEGEELVYEAASGTAAQHRGVRLRIATSLSGSCVRTGQVLRCDDSERDARVDRGACRRLGVRSMICVPLIHEGTALGVVKVVAGAPDAFTDEDVQTLCLMGGLLAAAMGRALAFEAKQALLAVRTQALESLQRSEARFRAALEGSLDAFFLAECVRDAGGAVIDFRFVDANHRAALLSGVALERLVGGNMSAIFPGGRESDLFPAFVAVVETGETLDREVAARTPSVTASWLRIQVVRVGDGIAITTRDITERRRAAAALAASHDMLRVVVEGTTDAVFLKDLEGRYEMINEAGARLLGRTAAEVVGLTDWSLFDAASAQRTKENDQAVLTLGVPMTYEDTSTVAGTARTFLTTKNVRRDASGAITGLLGIAHDITERVDGEDALRESEQRLRESEVRFRNAFDYSGIGMALVAPDGRWLRVNRALCGIVGYEEAELLAMSFQQITHPDDLQTDLQFVRALLAGESETYQMEKRYLHRAGHFVPVLLTVSLVHGATGAPLHFIAQVQDIAERKRAVEVKDQFLSHVSHELRSPVTAIYQFVTILLDGLAGELSAEQREYLEIVLKNTYQLRGMIGDLLEVARAETGKLTLAPRRVDPADAIADVVQAFTPTAAAKRVTLRREIGGDVLPVYADPARVRQILTNLVDNAIKFTPERGTISIRSAPSDEHRDFVCISVADTGCGIDPERTSLVFDRLHQEPNASDGGRKGLGLGLHICRELVARQGGRIWVDSRQGVGTVFSFTLPVFSLTNLLFPVITEVNRLHGSVALITLKIRPGAGVIRGRVADDTLERAWSVLQRCTLPALDVLLPRMGAVGGGEIFFLVACTDQGGARVLTRRVEEQLGRCPDLEDEAVEWQLFTTMLDPPPLAADSSIDDLVRSVATRVEEHMTAAMARGGIRG